MNSLNSLFPPVLIPDKSWFQAEVNADLSRKPADNFNSGHLCISTLLNLIKTRFRKLLNIEKLVLFLIALAVQFIIHPLTPRLDFKLLGYKQFGLKKHQIQMILLKCRLLIPQYYGSHCILMNLWHSLPGRWRATSRRIVTCPGLDCLWRLRRREPGLFYSSIQKENSLFITLLPIDITDQ